MERFERFDRDLRTLSASFRQIVRTQDTDPAQSVEGTGASSQGDRT